MRYLLVLLALALGACDGGAPAPPPTETPLAEWLRANVHALDTAAPRDDVSDLRFLDDLVGDARVVALGEATHGTREFFQIKDRVVGYLVDELGFDAVVFEGDLAPGAAIDAYIRGGAGDAEALVGGFHLWPWRTEEVADLVRGLRARNAAGGAVGFYGADVQYPFLQADLVLDAVAEVEPDSLGAVRALLDCVGAPWQGGVAERDVALRAYPDRPAPARAACRRDVAEAGAYLDRQAERYRAALGAAAFGLARRAATAVGQGERLAASGAPGEGDPFAVRDRAMADNVLWLLDHLGPDARVAVWAHNVHVSRFVGDLATLGEFLDADLGDDYRALGFAFHRGTVTGYGDGRLRAVDVGAGPAESFGALFSTAGLPLFALDLRQDLGGPAAPLARSRPFRQYGSVVEPGPVGPARLPDWFDAVVFVEESTPTRLLPAPAGGAVSRERPRTGP